MITRKEVADKIVSYLNHHITLSKLVDWAENIMMNDREIDEKYAEDITQSICHIGVADVKQFGLTWDDCQIILRKLGYEANVNVKLVA